MQTRWKSNAFFQGKEVMLHWYGGRRWDANRMLSAVASRSLFSSGLLKIEKNKKQTWNFSHIFLRKRNESHPGDSQGGSGSELAAWLIRRIAWPFLSPLVCVGRSQWDAEAVHKAAATAAFVAAAAAAFGGHVHRCWTTRCDSGPLVSSKVVSHTSRKGFSSGASTFTLSHEVDSLLTVLQLAVCFLLWSSGIYPLFQNASGNLWKKKIANGNSGQKG